MKTELVILPRVSMSWPEFRERAEKASIALDGIVVDGPQWDGDLGLANFDHHSGCVREATMSTAMQVMFAIKGGLMQNLARFGTARIWINDPDQDTSLASWLLVNHHLFEGIQSHPHINRLLALNDRLDITGGAYPMHLNDDVLQMHNWVFEPYSELRTSGALASADAGVMRNCIDAIHARLNSVLVGAAGRRPIRSEAKILYRSPHGYSIIDEVDGNEARYVLFAHGLDAFVSRVAERSDGQYVYSIGKRSRYIRFPVKELYDELTKAEYAGTDVTTHDVWGGSDIIGGSPRERGSRLDWVELRNVIDGFLGRRS